MSQQRLKIGSCSSLAKRKFKGYRGAQVGEIDVDSELVASAQQLEGREDIIMMLNNGCLCCTVRDDLIGMLKELVRSSHPNRLS